MIYNLGTRKRPVNSLGSYSILQNVFMAQDRKPWGPVNKKLPTVVSPWPSWPSEPLGSDCQCVEH